EERDRRERAWSDVVVGCRRRRLARARRSPAPPPEIERARVWQLARALDASPRDDPSLGADALSALAHVAARAGAVDLHQSLARPIALALAAAAEPALAAHALLPTELATALLFVRSARVLRYFAGVTRLTEAAELALGVADVRKDLKRPS